jgi:small subunit ribosomal protein S23
VYEQDRIRRQFFRDFPYEALRPTSLVEGREVGGESLVDGKEWNKLSQRGNYPTVEE